MVSKSLDIKIKKKLIQAQRNEISEHFIYKRLAQSVKDPHNREILETISKDELKHYHLWKKYTKVEVSPSRFKICLYFFVAKVLGLTFGIKLMETGEGHAQLSYRQIAKIIPEAREVILDEDAHERQLIGLIDEDRLRYVGSMILGMNDALVELTGTLAGLTLALQNARLIALTGLIMGIAASLSMAASEYLSTKSEGGDKNPVKASFYTGMAYVATVAFLVFPYLLFQNYLFCLGFTLFNAILVVGFFTFYLSVAKELSFSKRFFEMIFISFCVAGISFGLGYLVRVLFHV